ncbi:MAG: helix-turn-helix domain-containing protein [Roseburia sp.]|nr:helix-turn-helix domain-containing protein [Roseburia sp.]
MMKKTLYFCNRCSKEIKTEGTRIIPQFFDTTTDELLNEIGIPDNDVHFCLDCTKKILQELLDLPGMQEEEGTDTETGEQNVPPKRRVRLDAGKVMALHNAGWSNEEIAAEMKVTERQIYQCIRYQNNKNNPACEPDGEEKEDEEQL